MRLRTSKYLIRTTLLLICFQFLAPAFVSESGASETLHHHGASLHKQLVHSNLASALFEKEEKEAEEEDAGTNIFSVALLDFAVSYSSRISASQVTVPFHAISGHLQEPTLFTLHCTFLI
jgi:hypothetical protein